MHRFGVQEAPRTISKTHEGHMVKAPEGLHNPKPEDYTMSIEEWYEPS